jgi:hypothetical protein
MILANIRNKEKNLTVTVPCQRELLQRILLPSEYGILKGDIFLRDDA